MPQGLILRVSGASSPRGAAGSVGGTENDFVPDETASALRGDCGLCCASFCEHCARAGVSFDTVDSSVKITHYALVNNASAFGSKNVSPPPLSGSLPTPGTYQYSKVLSLNGGSSSASASAGAITNSQNVGVTFSSGTGLTQTDPSNSIGGPAQLKFQIDQEWNVTAGGFGPTAYGYVAFTLGGVVQAGNSASVSVDLSWTNASNTNLRARSAPP